MNFSKRGTSSLQLGHQEAKKIIKIGFPLRALREVCVPFKSLREKGGASLFSENICTPKEAQEGHSGGEEGADFPSLRGIKRKETIPMIINKRAMTFFIFIFH
jgi:hypothetical protein